jgi:hypothetical protein
MLIGRTTDAIERRLRRAKWRVDLSPPIDPKRSATEMRRFNPDREGAAHTVDATDLVLLRGTPVWDKATNATLDIRLRVDNSGNAEKAAWIHYQTSNATSVRDELVTASVTCRERRPGEDRERK